MERAFRMILAASLLLAGSASAEQRIIVRALGGQSVLSLVCAQLGCGITRTLGDPLGQLFLVGIPDGASLASLLRSLLVAPGILAAEVDARIGIAQNRPAIPEALRDDAAVSYFGVQVRSGYVSQPAVEIIRLAEAQTQFDVSGKSTIALIDTGVDPGHPVLRSVLAEGYDFTRNRPNGSEAGDVTQSTVAVVDGIQPTYVGDRAAAVIGQSTATALDQPSSAAFGHGTMVAGILHLIAPRSVILPFKVFGPDGSGYISDILRAVYTAVRSNARVINMSFSIPHQSPELERSINYASRSGAVCVASAGNDGVAGKVYPAAYTGVIGVASTTNADDRSSFSNFGTPLVWVAAPGEGIVTTYPFGTYAAAWGTSFSAPVVAGTAALLLEAHGSMTPSAVAAAIAHAKPLTADLGNGRLDIVAAMASVQ